jgi:Pectate lyase superfamily protein
MSSELVFNVMAFGAVGDGATDDTQAIYNAIAAASAIATTTAHQTVYFPRGRYYVNSPSYQLTPASYVTLQGEGMFSSTILAGAAFAVGAILSSSAAYNDFVIQDLGFDTGGHAGIGWIVTMAYGHSNWLIARCRFANLNGVSNTTASWGLIVGDASTTSQTCSNIQLRDNFFDATYSGTTNTLETVLAVSWTDSSIVGNYFYDQWTGAQAVLGIYGYGARINVFGNTFNQCSGSYYVINHTDVDFRDNTHYMTLAGGAIGEGANSVYIANCVKLRIRGERFICGITSSTEPIWGIRIVDGPTFDGHDVTYANSSDLFIDGCTFDSYQYGIQVGGGTAGGAMAMTDIYVTNCRFLNMVNAGFYLAGNSTSGQARIVIDGCTAPATALASGGWSIVEIDAPSGNTISDITIRNCKIGAITGTSTSAIGCEVAGTSAIFTVVNNDFSGNTNPVRGGGAKLALVRGNAGFNPVGELTGTTPLPGAPSFPASGTATTPCAFDCTVIPTAGTSPITAVQIGGVISPYATIPGYTVAASSSGSPIRVPAGQQLKYTYAGGSPSHTWFGE